MEIAVTKLALILLASVVVAPPGLAAPAAHPVAFERDGVAFVGTVTELGDGTKIVSGRDTNSGRDFDLRVSHGQVTGTVGGSEVSYAVPQHQPVATTVAFDPR